MSSPKGRGSFKVVTNPSDRLRPCEANSTDLSGLVTHLEDTDGEFLFEVEDIDTSSM